MEEHTERSEKFLAEEERPKHLLDEDRQRIAKLATEIKHDGFLFTISLIWLAVWIVVLLYVLYG